MSTNPEQDGFQELRRLLALKRYEQPPPGFFDSFSRDVITRIRSEQALGADDLLTHVEDHAPWLARLWTALQTKPLLAGAFGACVCGLLVTGLILSEKVEPAPVASLPVEPPPSLQAQVRPASPLFQSLPPAVSSSTEGVPSAQPAAVRGPAFQGPNAPMSPFFQTLEYKPAGN